MSDPEPPRPKLPPKLDRPPYPLPAANPDLDLDPVTAPGLDARPSGTAPVGATAAGSTAADGTTAGGTTADGAPYEPPEAEMSDDLGPESPHRPRVPGPPDGPDRTMVCPYCLSEFAWNSAPLVDRTVDGEEIALTREPGESDVRWRTRTMHAWRVCEATGKDHFVPASLGGMTVLIVGMVGTSGSGKSHLLAAMTEELDQAALKISHRLDVLPLDPRLQRELFARNRFDLLRDRKPLPVTRRALSPEFTCAYRITSGHTGEQYALLIFDVPGEIFSQGHTRDDTPFMSIADGLVFVADGTELDVRHGRHTGDPGFTAVLSHIDHVRAGRSLEFLPLPAALVIAKSDTLRAFKEVDRWLDRRDDLELGTVEEESEDAYALLRSRGAGSWLVPVQKCEDATLHFASATGVGVDMESGEYPEQSFRRQRVLRPLLALLAMKGVLPREVLGAPAGREVVAS
ncbi:hypothetical protein BKA00_002408 [Actinomadura coerulea]|uniref:Uncharacterized protein n=1 Tax=Actinomadura coerulea TaxID=46159 RepID=A0A7X0KYU8_9ACTN|nr:hypothetical protein [Actinomadura coerulea]GGQ25878.1 hypothetical protein GCM10010187_48120 [Actinomadura coerulea]